MTCAEPKSCCMPSSTGADAGHAREEAHLAGCLHCARNFVRIADAASHVGCAAAHTAPAGLRHRIDAAGARTPCARCACREPLEHAEGFPMGTALDSDSGEPRIGVIGTDQDQHVLGDYPAHVRCFRESLTDVETSDQHTVKPWFNGKPTLAAGGGPHGPGSR